MTTTNREQLRAEIHADRCRRPEERAREAAIATASLRCGPCGDDIEVGATYYQHSTGMIECQECHDA